MTIKRRVIKGSSIWSAEDVEHFYSRQEIIIKAKDHATKLWKLLVEKLGVRLAKDMMNEIMGDKKPGPRRTDEDEALIKFIRLHIQTCDSNQSDEQIAKSIFKRKPHYLREKFSIDDLRDELTMDIVEVVSKKSVEMTVAKNPKAMAQPVGKGLAALEKQVGRIRREVLEEGSLPKAYAPRPYRRD